MINKKYIYYIIMINYNLLFITILVSVFLKYITTTSKSLLINTNNS